MIPETVFLKAIIFGCNADEPMLACELVCFDSFQPNDNDEANDYNSTF